MQTIPKIILEEGAGPMGKVYEYRTTVTIGDTNLFQNMYYVNIFKLQGICRELWVRDCVENAMESFTNGYVAITKSASNEFINDFHLHDRILIQAQFVKIGHTYVDMRFRCFEETSMELRSVGVQRLICAGPDHKPCRFPSNFKKAILEYYDYSEMISNQPSDKEALTKLCDRKRI